MLPPALTYGIRGYGKRALITGASSGLGAAMARQLGAGGAVVGLIARRRGRLAEVLADCRKASPESTMWVADLADTSAVDGLAVDAWDALGGVDVLIDNAATPKRRTVTALTPAEVEAVMRVNFFAPMRLTLAVLPRMLDCGTGMSTSPASVAGSASSTNPPTAQANSRCAGGASRWPSTYTEPGSR